MSADRLARMVRQGRWVRLSNGVYDTDPVPVDGRDRDDVFDHRRRRQAWVGLLAFGPTAIAVGQSALALHEIQGLPVDIASEVMLPGGSARASRDGVLVRQYEAGLPTEHHAGRRVATVLRALAQAVPTLDRRHAVAVLDNAVHARRITRAEVEVAHDLARGRRGVDRTHPWWRLVDGRAESPLETWARLECIDAGRRARRPPARAVRPRRAVPRPRRPRVAAAGRPLVPPRGGRGERALRACGDLRRPCTPERARRRRGRRRPTHHVRGAPGPGPARRRRRAPASPRRMGSRSSAPGTGSA